MNTRYFELSTPEKLSLSDQEFSDSVKLEAIHRNILIPITLSDALNRVQFRGFEIPPDSVTFYEVMTPTEYGSPNSTTLCFRTSDEAEAAMRGAVAVIETGYGNTKRLKIVEGEFRVQQRRVSLSKPEFYRSRLEEFYQDNTAFDAMAKECTEDLSKLHQEAYNERVNAERRAEYLRLAGGNEEIAEAFWKKQESIPWPKDEAEKKEVPTASLGVGF